MGFGREPEPETITLTLGADYTQKINIPPETPLPDGTVVTIKFYPPRAKNTPTSIAEWAATVTPELVQWRVESALADAIPDKAHFRIYVSYPDTPTLEHCWYVGDVIRKQ
ncbi:DUF7264 domain-containing protein [Nocardia abscessus]|uniref:LtfC-like domain-containing protein n=1 Tax=Nocardia abscessus TaxID=120957 RepID=UPI002453D5C8|nr:hypothetical protein [Nocardia abscessus]